MSDDEALRAWLDGTADEAACAALAKRLDHDPELVRQLLDHARDEALLSTAVRSPPNLTPRVLAGLRGPQSRLRLRRAVMREVHSRRGRRWAPLLVAAAVVAALGLVALQAWPTAIHAPAHLATPAARIGRAIAARDTELLRDGVWRTLVPGDLLANDRIRVVVGGSAELTIDGVAFVLSDGADLRLDGPAHSLLAAGSLRAEVAPRPAGQGLVIATPQATASVLGTVFSLVVADSRTRLEVTRGRVRLANAHGASEVAVGGFAEAEAGAAPTGSRDLFADFSAWKRQHGHWSRDGATVRGEGGAGKARLLSPTSHRDLELVCRLRIRDTEFAEIQIGEYNWFIEVPASVGWIDVRLRQRGDDVTCTADGQLLQLHPGDGGPSRPGPLSFYVRTGSLEIADARIRE